jgi:single-strand DNA-binding protein
MFNEVTLIGRLGSDPEVKYKSGTQDMFVVVSLATTRNWKNGNGEKQEAVEWHQVIFSNKLAEIVKEFLKKGALIFVRGRIHTRKWADEGGTNHYSTEIIAHDLRMLGRALDKGKEQDSDPANDAVNQENQEGPESAPQ